jgi:hypothetical protein
MSIKLPPTFSLFQTFASYENEYFRLNENTIKNGNCTKFANVYKLVSRGTGFIFGLSDKLMNVLNLILNQI